MMNAATSNCMVTKLAQGRAWGGIPASPISVLPTPGICSLKGLVIHSSVSCIRQFEQDFHDDCRNRYKQARKCGQQTDYRVLQYNICAPAQNHVAHAQEHGFPGLRGLSPDGLVELGEPPEVEGGHGRSQDPADAPLPPSPGEEHDGAAGRHAPHQVPDPGDGATPP